MTSQDDPASPVVKIAPRTEHEPEETAYDTAPVPEPPDVVKFSAIPKMADTELITKDVCDPLAKTTVVSADDVAE